MKSLFLKIFVLATLIFMTNSAYAVVMSGGEFLPEKSVYGIEPHVLNRLAVNIDLKSVDREFLPFSIWFIDKCNTIKNIKLPAIRPFNVQKLIDDYKSLLQVLHSV